MGGQKKYISQPYIEVADHGTHSLVNHDGHTVIFADQGMKDANVEV
jgi:hypothetical protein